MYFAIGVDLKKLIATTSLFVNNESTDYFAPLITLKTPSGNPASLNN